MTYTYLLFYRKSFSYNESIPIIYMSIGTKTHNSKRGDIMRKIIGFVFFVISATIIAVVIIENIDILAGAFDDITLENFLTTSGLMLVIVWQLLYQPIVVLLLSVIAMGNYK